MVVKLHCLHVWGSFIPEKHSHSKALELLEHHSQGLPAAGSPEERSLVLPSWCTAGPALSMLLQAQHGAPCTHLSSPGNV